MPLSQVNITHPDVYFVQYNLFNSFYMNLTQASEYYVEGLIAKTTQKESIFFVLLFIAALSLILAMSVLFPILIKVSKQKEKVLSLFLDIPERQVKNLYNKCETFISNLQVEDDDEL